jgi:hypothetical protein
LVSQDFHARGSEFFPRGLGRTAIQPGVIVGVALDPAGLISKFPDVRPRCATGLVGAEIDARWRPLR